MRFFLKAVICLIIFVSLFIILYTVYVPNAEVLNRSKLGLNAPSGSEEDGIKTLRSGGGQATSLKMLGTGLLNGHRDDVYNIWCIFTKVNTNTPLKLKFKTFITSLLEYSNARLRLNLISDNSSLPLAETLLREVEKLTGKVLELSYYNVQECAKEADDIVQVMKPHFSSQPGTYYSDVLFFLSLGLHRFAKHKEHRAILFDADIKLNTDVAQIFQEFDKFGTEAVFGLAAEQTPVYRHVLYSFRTRHPDTVFGTPASRGGVPGVNSGVLLLDLDRMRHSDKYRAILTAEAVANLTHKYSFKGHLGDQDLYTLIAMDSPSLIHTLPCEWNRQLCTWWRDHGYRDIFEEFHRCDEPVKAYHGNCNTPIPAT